MSHKELVGFLKEEAGKLQKQIREARQKLAAIENLIEYTGKDSCKECNGYGKLVTIDHQNYRTWHTCAGCGGSGERSIGGSL